MLRLNGEERTLPELAFISLGSNIEPESNLPLATTQLRSLGTLVACSRVYQNPAIAPEPQQDYLNAAVLIETELPPSDIRVRLREIETQLGRIRTADKYAPRTIDLDLSLYGDHQIQTSELTLPDPDIGERPYLAKTLAELRPQMVYPGSNLTLSQIAEALLPGSQLTERHDVVLLKQVIDHGEVADD